MLITGRTKPSFSKHKLRDIVMLVLHPFFADFSAKVIYVDIEECYDYVYVDFESFHVALYHILEMPPNIVTRIKIYKSGFQRQKMR